MGKETKKVKSAKFISKYEQIFHCPICQSPMEIIELKSLICARQHTFDLAKQGYINLTTKPVQTKYDKALFEARRNLLVAGEFYRPVVEAISKIIRNQVTNKNEPISILDTGCGEGSHLKQITDLVDKNIVGVGIDLAKEGIMAAAKHYENNIWLVADLANTPFKNHQFDVILNILSPSNYGEFKRILKEDGIVIKVVPQEGYLKELRQHIFQDSAKQNYTNEDTVERFTEHYQYVDQKRITYTAALSKPFLQSLVQMTPLTWNIPEEELHSFLSQQSAQITVDLDILIGSKPI